MEAFKGATMLIGGGMTTAVTVELLSQLDPEACGVWLTAFQVLGIAMSASKSQLSKSNNPTSTKETKSTKSTKETKQSTKSQTLFIPRLFTKRKIPILTHCTSASLVAVAMIASNSAIAYQIPLPLHILLKSASLPASAFISYYTGRLTLNKPTIGAISTVTAGVLIATIGGAPPSSSTRSSLSKRNSTLIGGLLAAGSVVASAILGAFQDNTFETYGKHWREALFYSHALTLPSFFLFRKQLYQILKRWLQPKKRNIKLWLLLLSNIACVNVAMSGIYKITNETSSLSCTIAVTVRKFLSLLLSLQLFNKGIFGKSQWIGTMGVFGGSLFWTLLRAFSSPTTRSKKKKHINNQITKQIDPRIQESLNPIYLPSPSQQLHLIFNYPESNTKNDFRSIVVDILKTADVKHTLNSYGNDHETLLSKLHLQKGARLGRKNQKHSPFHKAFKTIVHRKGNTETHQLLNVRFNTIMKHFVRTVVAPLLEVSPNDVLYQAKPNFRISHPSDVPMGGIHNDYKSNNHQPGEINFWIPFCSVFKENTLWVESAPGANDFEPMEMKYGQGLKFWGNQCRHHTVANVSDCTRVSIDFRAIAKKCFNSEFVDSRGVLLQRRVGEFYVDSGM